MAKATKYPKLYLNDYVGLKPSLRIELEAGGGRTLWAAQTTKKAMEYTKAYLTRLWERD